MCLIVFLSVTQSLWVNVRVCDLWKPEKSLNKPNQWFPSPHHVSMSISLLLLWWWWWATITTSTEFRLLHPLILTLVRWNVRSRSWWNVIELNPFSNVLVAVVCGHIITLFGAEEYSGAKKEQSTWGKWPVKLMANRVLVC